MIRLTDEENPYPDSGLVPIIKDIEATRTMMHRAFELGAEVQLKKVVEILGGYQIDMGREDVDKFPMVYLRILEKDWRALLEEARND